MQQFAVFEGNSVAHGVAYNLFQGLLKTEKLVRDIQLFHLYPKVNLEIISQAKKKKKSGRVFHTEKHNYKSIKARRKKKIRGLQNFLNEGNLLCT